MQHAQVSALTASGDTVKTLIDTITTPLEARKLVGVWSTHVAAAPLTSGEAATGILELESDDVPIVPLQLPIHVVSLLTSGAIGFEPRIIPLNIDLKGQCRIKGYITMDMAQTGALKSRFGIITE